MSDESLACGVAGPFLVSWVYEPFLIDAHIDDGSARFDPVPFDHFGTADGSDQNVATATDSRQVAGPAVGHR